MKTYVLYHSSDFNKDVITGGTKRIQEIIKFLVKNGNKVHLFAPKDVDVYKNENLIIHPIKTIKIRILPVGLLTFIYNIHKLRSIKKINYDCFLVISVPFGIQATLLHAKKITFIIWEDFIGLRAIKQKATKNFFRLLYNKIAIVILILIERYVLLNVEKVITQCNYDKENTLLRHRKERLKMEPKFRKIFNNVNPSWIIKQKELIRRGPILKKKNDVYTVHFIGNIHNTHKGLHLLLESVRTLIDKNYNINLRIIGGGELLEKYINENIKYSSITFLGFLDEPMKELVNSELLIVPSLVDSFPNTIMEALYLEIPVIGSKTGGIPEMLEFKELLFEANAGALYMKMKDIIDNTSLEDLRQLCIRRKKELTFNWVGELQKIL